MAPTATNQVMVNKMLTLAQLKRDSVANSIGYWKLPITLNGKKSDLIIMRDSNNTTHTLACTAVPPFSIIAAGLSLDETVKQANEFIDAANKHDHVLLNT